MIKNFCRKRRSILWYSKRQIVWNLNENKIPPLQTIRNEKPHRTPQCGPDNVKCFIYVSGQFAFHGTINSSFRSLRRGTARAVGQIQDDSVWANKQSTDRPLAGQTRSNVANVVIVIGLIFRCGAARRPTAAAVMAAGLFEFTKPWKRDYAPVFGKRMPYWPSRAAPAIRLRRVAARKRDVMT